MELDERAKKPVETDDVILKITYVDSFEVERITNKTPEEMQEVIVVLTKLENKGTQNIYDCLKSYGADYIPMNVQDTSGHSVQKSRSPEILLEKITE